MKIREIRNNHTVMQIIQKKNAIFQNKNWNEGRQQCDTMRTFYMHFYFLLKSINNSRQINPIIKCIRFPIRRMPIRGRGGQKSAISCLSSLWMAPYYTFSTF